MPKPWTDTIQAHRREIHDAILNTAAACAAEGGLRSVTIAQIAEDVGISRPTLYKYFPDVEAILAAWQERRPTGHLAQLNEAAALPGDPCQRLQAVLTGYAHIQFQLQLGGSPELSGYLNRGGNASHLQGQLHELIRQLLASAAEAGWIRADVTAGELAS